jgi:hypothetical protein
VSELPELIPDQFFDLVIVKPGHRAAFKAELVHSIIKKLDELAYNDASEYVECASVERNRKYYIARPNPGAFE